MKKTIVITAPTEIKGTPNELEKININEEINSTQNIASIDKLLNLSANYINKLSGFLVIHIRQNNSRGHIHPSDHF